MSDCQHLSRTPEGCPICDRKAQVRESGPVTSQDGVRFYLCLYCGNLVLVRELIHHELPECAEYLADSPDDYLAKLEASAAGGGD